MLGMMLGQVGTTRPRDSLEHLPGSGSLTLAPLSLRSLLEVTLRRTLWRELPDELRREWSLPTKPLWHLRLTSVSPRAFPLTSRGRSPIPLPASSSSTTSRSSSHRTLACRAAAVRAPRAPRNALFTWKQLGDFLRRRCLSRLLQQLQRVGLKHFLRGAPAGYDRRIPGDQHEIAGRANESRGLTSAGQGADERGAGG